MTILIPTEVVGSLPRPQALQEAFANYDAGKIDRDALVAEQDKAAKDSVQRMEQTGEELVTDGEREFCVHMISPRIILLDGQLTPH